MGTKEQWLVWNKNRRERNRAYRIKCIEFYSNGENKCFCCGENNIEFLAVDHINGCGGKHRKFVQKHYRNIYYFLVKTGFPSGYRIACHNCNLSMGFYGYCPHNKSEDCLESERKLGQSLQRARGLT